MRGISIKAIFLATLAVLGIDIVWFRLLGLGLTLPAALLGARISQRQG